MRATHTNTTAMTGQVNHRLLQETKPRETKETLLETKTNGYTNVKANRVRYLKGRHTKHIFIYIFVQSVFVIFIYLFN